MITRLSTSPTLPQHGNRLRSEVLGLWARNLPEASQARYDWLYQSEVATSEVLRHDDGQPIGSAGLMHREFIREGRAVAAGQAIDLNVDRPYRTIGPALSLQRRITAHRESESLDFIYGIPSPQAVPALKRVGYREVGPLQRWVLPLKSAHLIQKHIGSQWLAGGLAFLGDQLLRAERAVRLCRPPRYQVEKYCFDSRFDELWERSTAIAPILGERNAHYLNWRYRQYPDVDYDTITLSDPTGDNLIGYAIACEDRRTMCISDILSPTRIGLEHTLAAAICYGVRQRYISIEITCFGSPQLLHPIARLGFRRRALQRPFMIYAPGHSDNDALLNSSNWYITKADSDQDM